MFVLIPDGRDGAACSSSWTALGSPIAVPSSSVCGDSVGLSFSEGDAPVIATVVPNMKRISKIECTRATYLEF